MTMPSWLLGTDRHVRLAQMHCIQKRGHWHMSGARAAGVTPPINPPGQQADDTVLINAASNPPAQGKALPHPKRALFSLVNADVSHGNLPPSYPMPGEV